MAVVEMGAKARPWQPHSTQDKACSKVPGEAMPSGPILLPGAGGTASTGGCRPGAAQTAKERSPPHQCPACPTLSPFPAPPLLPQPQPLLSTCSLLYSTLKHFGLTSSDHCPCGHYGNAVHRAVPANVRHRTGEDLGFPLEPKSCADSGARKQRRARSPRQCL